MFALALVYAVGLCVTAVFNQYAGMPPIVETLNIAGAFGSILAGSAIIVGTRRRRLLLPAWLGPASVALGVVGSQAIARRARTAAPLARSS